MVVVLTCESSGFASLTREYFVEKRRKKTTIKINQNKAIISNDKR